MRILYNKENKTLVVSNDDGMIKSPPDSSYKIRCQNTRQLMVAIDTATVITGNRFEQVPGTFMFVEQK